MEAVEEIRLQVSIRRDEPDRRLGGEGRLGGPGGLGGLCDLGGLGGLGGLGRLTNVAKAGTQAPRANHNAQRAAAACAKHAE